ncbi:hypothetical protein [Rariglobus hedericola]|uniref:Uncharacterized protein n=1 Tax=Rariglobus hedericola TaxID=2597822 RepID=A0A556QSC0_9BACT|nr:hypothetical protein [Rariglobus hedericola]TSJ79523.1 hypothetical protein FPL22_09620 [Rariglobus hedericola]
MRIFLTSLSAVVLSVLLIPASAQTPSPKNPVRSLRFYYAGASFSNEDDVNPRAVFLLKNGKENVSVQLTANAFSRPLDYTGPLPIELFREQRTEAGVKREPLGELKCPDSWKGVLFIVTRNPANAVLPFRFYPIEDWAPSLPDEHVRIMNLCPYPLAAKTGTSPVAIAAQSTVDVTLSVGSDIALGLAVQRGGRWERILSTSILRPDQNKLQLLVFPNSDGAIRVVVIKDLPEPPPEATSGKLPRT